MHYHHRNSISIISSNSFLILLKLKGRFWGLTLKDKNCPVDIFSDKIFPCNICAGACHKKRSTDLIWQIEIKLGFRDSHLQATLDICPGNICPGHVYIVLAKQKLLTLFSSIQPPPHRKKIGTTFSSDTNVFLYTTTFFHYLDHHPKKQPENSCVATSLSYFNNPSKYRSKIFVIVLIHYKSNCFV